MNTEKLYYMDSHMSAFRAKVLSSESDGGRYLTVLDRTAFFPEGGGQAADTGVIGNVRVLDVYEKNGVIYHYTEQVLEPGAEYDCRLDWEQRFERMQGHSGEHIVSGIVHAKYGFDNFGFHMGSDCITIDFNGELSGEELEQVELEANMAVWKNVAVRAEFPSPEELKALDYRSKLDLTENVRIVTIEGYDKCACCAPHVSRSGEIGMIKLTDHMKHRGGTRVSMLCGSRALEDYREKQKSADRISALLSAKRDAVFEAVRRVNDELMSARYQNAELKRSVLGAQLAGLEGVDGNLCFFESAAFDGDSLRYLVNGAVELCGGIAAAFAGDDEKGYNYVMGSSTVDLRAKAKEINGALDGRGGGKPEMIQGSVRASRADIEKYFAE